MGITQNTGASSLIKPGVIDNTAARPASPFEGQVIFQKDTDQLLVWNGTAWVIPNSPAQNPMGLELITTKTFSGSATINCTSFFNSTYDHYRLVMSCTSAAVGGQIVETRLMQGSTATSGGTGYKFYEAGYIWAGSADVTAGTGGAYWFGFRSNTYFFGTMDIQNPYVATTTAFQTNAVDTAQSVETRGILTDTSQYDGIQFLVGSGTLTGTVSCYGYRK